MSEIPTTRSEGGRRRRRRSDRRSSGNRQSTGRARFSGESRSSRKPKNPIIAFFQRIFGLETKQPENGRRERSERTPRERRGDRAERSERAESVSGATPSMTDKLDVNEITTTRLYIGNLSYDASESDLFDLFSTVGSVQNIEIVRDKNMNSKGFGFAEMASVEAARALAEKFHRAQFMDRQLVVTGARKP